MKNQPVCVSTALQTLTTSRKWEVLDDYDTSTIIWHDADVPQPSVDSIEAARLAIAEQIAATAYIAQRAAEYPPMSDYLDGVVKGDQAQIDKYIADCLAVKAKYPKP